MESKAVKLGVLTGKASPGIHAFTVTCLHTQSKSRKCRHSGNLCSEVVV